jgi:putative molybdopterin biosynthesis protein
VQINLVFGNVQSNRNFIICGQDLILDVLSNYLRMNGIPALRAYIGSYDSLTGPVSGQDSGCLLPSLGQ